MNIEHSTFNIQHRINTKIPFGVRRSAKELNTKFPGFGGSLYSRSRLFPFDVECWMLNVGRSSNKISLLSIARSNPEGFA